MSPQAGFIKRILLSSATLYFAFKISKCLFFGVKNPSHFLHSRCFKEPGKNLSLTILFFQGDADAGIHNFAGAGLWKCFKRIQIHFLN